jgi:hypothetical protein
LNNSYLNGIKNAALSIQSFYKGQLNGTTFKLNDPIVEVIYSNKNANYFYTNPSHQDKDNWGYYNAFNEVKRLLGAKLDDPNYIWVIYSDGPGDKGRGGSGVCVMPEDDLLGLIGKHPTQGNINRWIGGGAHEIGHALGLNHPKDIVKHYKSIMWSGIYGFYPEGTYFTEDDKVILKNSPFITHAKTNKLVFNYRDGWFETDSTRPIEWVENKKDDTIKFHFKLIEQKSTYYLIKSIDRSIIIKLPKQKGYSFISTDNGKSWSQWWEIN